MTAMRVDHRRPRRLWRLLMVGLPAAAATAATVLIAVLARAAMSVSK